MTTYAESGETQNSLINVLVMSADGLRRDLLESGISGSSNVNVVEPEIAWDGDSIPEQSVPEDLDVVVLDMCQSPAVQRGLEIGHGIKAVASGCAVVVLAGTADILGEIRKQMSEVGPKWSFLTTDLITGLDDLIRIIDSAASGMTIVDPGFFTDTNGAGGRDSYLTRPLTARQIQVLELVSQGFNNEVVAEKLDISLRTVEHHLNEAYVSIKNCRSADINARVYAAKVYSECLV